MVPIEGEPTTSTACLAKLSLWKAAKKKQAQNIRLKFKLAHHLPPREQGIPNELSRPYGHVGRPVSYTHLTLPTTPYV